jgi:hypothetical protein
MGVHAKPPPAPGGSATRAAFPLTTLVRITAPSDTDVAGQPKRSVPADPRSAATTATPADPQAFFQSLLTDTQPRRGAMPGGVAHAALAAPEPSPVAADSAAHATLLSLAAPRASTHLASVAHAALPVSRDVPVPSRDVDDLHEDDDDGDDGGRGGADDALGHDDVDPADDPQAPYLTTINTHTLRDAADVLDDTMTAVRGATVDWTTTRPLFMTSALLAVCPDFGRLWPKTPAPDTRGPELPAFSTMLRVLATGMGMPRPGPAAYAAAVSTTAHSVSLRRPRAVVDAPPKPRNRTLGFDPGNAVHRRQVSQDGVTILGRRPDKGVDTIGFLGPRPHNPYNAEWTPLTYSATATLPPRRMLVAILANALNSRILGDSAALKVWLESSPSLYGTHGDFTPDTIRRIGDAILDGAIPELGLLATSIAPHPLSNQLHLTTALQRLADIMTELMGPDCPLVEDVTELLKANTVLQYAKVIGLRNRGASDALITESVATMIMSAATAWHRDATDAARAAFITRPLHEDGSRDVPQYDEIPRLTAYIAPRPGTVMAQVTMLTSALSLTTSDAAATGAKKTRTTAAVHVPASTDIVVPAPPRMPRPSERVPRVPGPPLDIRSDAAVNVVTRARADVTARRFTTIGPVTKAHPALYDLKMDGRDVCVRHLLFNTATPGGCPNGATCTYAHAPPTATTA